MHGKTDCDGSKHLHNTESLTESTVNQWNSSGNSFPGYNTLQLSDEVKSLLSRLGETLENFTGRNLVVSMFNDISCGIGDNGEECQANARLVSLYARRFGKMIMVIHWSWF